MTSINKSLYDDLGWKHEQLLRIDQELQEVRERFDIAAAHYARVRDLLRVRLGHSPYVAYQPYANWNAESLRLRLVNMPITDAINMILDEAENPLSVQQVVAELQWGGFEFPKESAPARVVQAAVANRKDLLSMEESGIRSYFLPGSYAENNIESWKEHQEKIEAEELPF